MQEKKKNAKKARIIGLLILAILLAGGVVVYRIYQRFMGPSVTDAEPYLFVHTGSTMTDLLENLERNGLVKDTASFRWVAGKMDFESIKPGKYSLEAGMSNRELVRKLRSGDQEAVKLRFENIRLREQFAGFVSTQLEPDSLAVMQYLANPDTASKYGFSTDNFFCMFIPNTYELYWNVSTHQFFGRMHDEYNRFWTDERKQKAEAINLSPTQVSILASIVKGEALHTDEMPKIAGLYLNRLKKGILLQADPTVIYANNDFTIRRVLNRHLRTDSPYNTYIYRGLPPGPIMMPSIAAIDAVLNFQQHNYIYMCAKDDFSGYHNFATTMSEHLVNARKFQQALDRRNIKK